MTRSFPRNFQGRLGTGILGAALLLAALALPMWAQSEPQAAPQPATPPDAVEPAPPADEAQQALPLRVTSVENSLGEAGEESGPMELKLGQSIKIRVKGLPDWLEQNTFVEEEVVLFIDGNRFERLPVGVVGGGRWLQFDLKRSRSRDHDAANARSWELLLSRMPVTESLSREVAVTVGGLGSDNPLPTSAEAELVLLYRDRLYWFAGGLLAVLAIFLWLVNKSDIIREPGPDPPGGERKPYSLARTQMAVWFFLVVAAFVFIWMVTSSYSALNVSVLALIGLSTGTGLLASVVDTSKRTETQTRLSALKRDLDKKTGEGAARRNEAASLQASGVPLTDDVARLVAVKQGEVATVSSEIQGLQDEVRAVEQTMKPRAGQQFFRDILGDGEGISFHRFQMLIWTLVLGLVFVFSVIRSLSMPDFPLPILALMGISGGTYIGFKVPEK